MNLAEGIALLGLALPAGVEEKFAAYIALLAKWNKTYNLTSIRDPQEMVTHHLLDSLAVLPVMTKSVPAGRRFTLADVGSGAGLPGLILAIACPEWSVTSIDAAGKKVAFQRQVKIELGLTNVLIECRRVEQVHGSFDAVITRAFASLTDFVRLAGHLADSLWAMKGGYPENEVLSLPDGWGVQLGEELEIPGLQARRHLLRLGRT